MTTAATDPQPPMGAAKTEQQVLVALCRMPGCGAEAIVGDPGSPALRHLSLNRLEDELRCACGARRGRLTKQPFWGPRPARQGGIYLFVA